MHHTDYSNILRKAQHKTIKNLSLNTREQSHDRANSPEIIPAILAISMVILALFQMDPANADSTTIGNKTAPPVQQQSVQQEQAPAPASDTCSAPHPLTSILVDRPNNCAEENKDRQIKQSALSVEAVVDTFQFATPVYPVTAGLPL